MSCWNDPRALRLRDVLTAFVQAKPGWAYRQDQLSWVYVFRTGEEIGRELVDQVGFCDVQLAGFLDSPDGVLIREVVSWVLPYGNRQEVDLLVVAVVHAARADQQRRRGAIVGWTAAACALVFLLFKSLES